MPFSDIDVAEAFYHHSELYMKTENVSTTVASGNFTTMVYNAVNLKTVRSKVLSVQKTFKGLRYILRESNQWKMNFTAR